MAQFNETLLVLCNQWSCHGHPCVWFVFDNPQVSFEMLHEEAIKNNIDEHDAIWEAISQLEDVVKEQRKALEQLSSRGIR